MHGSATPRQGPLSSVYVALRSITVRPTMVRCIVSVIIKYSFHRATVYVACVDY